MANCRVCRQTLTFNQPLIGYSFQKQWHNKLNGPNRHSREWMKIDGPLANLEFFSIAIAHKATSWPLSLPTWQPSHVLCSSSSRRANKLIERNILYRQLPLVKESCTRAMTLTSSQKEIASPLYTNDNKSKQATKYKRTYSLLHRRS